MSILKRFRAGCLGLVLGTLGTTPVIAQPPANALETQSTAIVPIAQASEAEPEFFEQSDPEPGASEPGASESAAPSEAVAEPSAAGDRSPSSPSPSSIISVTTGDIVLLDEGQGEKAPLRLAPEVGNTLQLGADLTIQVTMKIDGETVPNPGFPSVAMVLGLEVIDVNPNAGEITYNITYDAIELGTDTAFPEAARAAIDEVFQELKDLKLVLVGDDRGRVLSANVEAPEDLNPFLVQMLDSLSQSMKQVSAPLPEEAVGIGARWSITGSITAGGLTFDQTATYTLVERTGDRFIVALEVTQQADSQTVGEDSIAIQLTDYNATGTGKMEMDLSYPIPVSGLIDLISTTQLKPPHLDQTITSQAEVRMELKPVSVSTATP